MINSNRIGNPHNSKQFRCCFGLLHVRTATCCIGIWHLMLNLLAITLLAVIVKNPGMMQNMNGVDSYDDELIPTPVSSKIEPTAAVEAPYHYRDHSLNYQDMDMGGLVCLCMIAITLMLIYGTVKGRPSHLLPFFFLQLCDFAITTLTAAGYLCYLRTIHHLIEQSNRLPWKEDLIRMDPRTLGVVVLFAFIFMVMLKAYCIGIVWRCYKYLTIRHNASLLTYIIPDGATQERSFNSLLPDYEEALSMKVAAPPSYDVAMQTQQAIVASSTPASPVASSASDMDPPSYHLAEDVEISTEPSTNEEGNEIHLAHEIPIEMPARSTTSNQVRLAHEVPIGEEEEPTRDH